MIVTDEALTAVSQHKEPKIRHYSLSGNSFLNQHIIFHKSSFHISSASDQEVYVLRAKYNSVCVSGEVPVQKRLNYRG